MKEKPNIYILIMVGPEPVGLSDTLESILSQTPGSYEVKVLLGDNSGDLAVYKTLLDYEIRYPMLVSVIREKEKKLNSYCMKHMIRHLRFSDVDYSMILGVGDVLEKDFIGSNLQLFREHSYGKAVVTEADIDRDTGRQSQRPVYKNDCILKSGSEAECYRRRLDHRILLMYKGMPLSPETKLFYYAFLSDWYNEWVVTALSEPFEEVIYVRRVGGTVKERNVEDPVTMLFKYAFMIKRKYYSIERQIQNGDDVSFSDRNKIENAYRGISMQALQYAVDLSGDERAKEKEDCLLFAEMINPKIRSEGIYEKTEKWLSDPVDRQDKRSDHSIWEEDVMPPEGALCF